MESQRAQVQNCRQRPLHCGRYPGQKEASRGVHQGYDRRTGTNCAIKLLLPTLRRYPRIRDRFEREAEVLLSLKHDHIVELFDHGVTDNHHWLAMELITGGSLVQRVRDNGPMDADSVIQLGISKPAMRFSSPTERGIIHRDIKPGNILMDAEGRTKIVDFGIAHVNDASKVLTRVGVKMGSVRFMAPEQRTGASSVGAPADIYGLGITLMSVLLGRTPKKPDEDLISLRGSYRPRSATYSFAPHCPILAVAFRPHRNGANAT